MGGPALMGLAIGIIAHAPAIAQPRIDLEVTPTWNGWTRPGRATEVDVRLATSESTRAMIDIVAGHLVVRTDLNLEPGRPVRLHVPVSSAERVKVSVESPLAPSERREVGVAMSESPLLGVALATDESFELEGFHAVALDVEDLPRNALAYSSIDALVLDARTLGELDQRQLGALLAYGAECGRTVLLNPDPGVRRVLEGAVGCGGRFLMNAGSLPHAREVLGASLSARTVPAMSPGAVGEFARSGHATWQRVLLILAVYFAASALAVVFFSSLPVLLLMPALFVVAILALLHALQPTSQLLVWSESDSGAPVARYQAWQRFPGHARGRARVALLPQLASVRPCDPDRPMRLDYDGKRGRAAFAEFDTRLFGQVSLCYSGNFPVSRAIAIESRPDGVLDVRNAGTMAWPEGALLAGRLVQHLPAVAPGESALVRTHAGKPPTDAVARAALSRLQTEVPAALWELQLSSVADVPIDSTAWLLVSIPPP